MIGRLPNSHQALRGITRQARAVRHAAGPELRRIQKRHPSYRPFDGLNWREREAVCMSMARIEKRRIAYCAATLVFHQRIEKLVAAGKLTADEAAGVVKGALEFGYGGAMRASSGGPYKPLHSDAGRRAFGNSSLLATWNAIAQRNTETWKSIERAWHDLSVAGAAFLNWCEANHAFFLASVEIDTGSNSSHPKEAPCAVTSSAPGKDATTQDIAVSSPPPLDTAIGSVIARFRAAA